MIRRRVKASCRITVTETECFLDEKLRRRARLAGFVTGRPYTFASILPPNLVPSKFCRIPYYRLRVFNETLGLSDLTETADCSHRGLVV
jgi:hypothetical protein